MGTHSNVIYFCNKSLVELAVLIPRDSRLQVKYTSLLHLYIELKRLIIPPVPLRVLT